MARTGKDTHTLDLFDVPCAPELLPGALAVDTQLRGLLSNILKETPLSRFEVAARMSELLDTEVSKHQLDAWTAESREAWRFPLSYLLAFEAACDTLVVTQFLAAKRGCKVLVGEDALLAELGRIEHQEQTLRTRKKALKQRMREKAEGVCSGGD